MTRSSHRVSRRALRWTVCVLLAGQATVLSAQSRPDEIEGLVAWYTVDSLHRELRDGESVSVWKDSSGQGHDLIDDRNGLTALFRTVELNRRPAVEVRKMNSFSVTRPFELEDHTIFLVYSIGALPPCALFRSAGDEKHGLILGLEGRKILYQNGKSHLVTRYNRAALFPTDLNVSVLGRESGALRMFINGRDDSSDVKFDATIRVGKFFQMKRTQMIEIDGEGLKLAEMVFYDRFLSDGERDAVTDYLAEEYAIELQPEPRERHTPPVPEEQAVQVWLGTGIPTRLNQPTVALEWDRQVKIHRAFRHEPDADKARLHYTGHRAPVRMFLRLPMKTDEPAARIRILLLKNGEIYHPLDRSTEPFEGPPGALTATVQFATTLTLKTGDYVEVIAVREGAEGEVTLLPDQAVWTAEIR